MSGKGNDDMKILQLAWENFGTNDMKDAFEMLNNEVVLITTSQEELLSNKIKDKLNDAINKNVPDVVFSFNYFPNVADICKTTGINYISWVYDNPCALLYSYTVLYPTNHIYVFDSDTYLKFAGQGINTIKYLPMAANPKRLSKLWKNETNHDISFIGSMYSEAHNFYDRMITKGIPMYTEGFLRGIMEAQKMVYGYNLIEDKLSDSIIADMYKALPLEPDEGSAITSKTLFTEYVINRQITVEERLNILKTVGRIFGNDNNIAVYTPGKEKIEGCNNLGTVDFYEEAPKVYHSSKINLNISLRSIVNGIPLRCFEIMGNCGFLLSNYAGDFQQFFINGEDYVSYDSIPDLIDKIDYYLKHDDERCQIAMNGYKKICEGHTYVHRAQEILGNL